MLMCREFQVHVILGVGAALDLDRARLDAEGAEAAALVQAQGGAVTLGHRQHQQLQARGPGLVDQCLHQGCAYAAPRPFVGHIHAHHLGLVAVLGPGFAFEADHAAQLVAFESTPELVVIAAQPFPGSLGRQLLVLFVAGRERLGKLPQRAQPQSPIAGCVVGTPSGGCSSDEPTRNGDQPLSALPAAAANRDSPTSKGKGLPPRSSAASLRRIALRTMIEPK